MIGEEELVVSIERLEIEVLRRWVEVGWVRPQRQGEQLRFDSADVARVHLICDLHYEIQIEESSLAVVLSLLDQVYDLRRSLRSLRAAVEGQPEAVRADIARRLALDRPEGTGEGS